MRGGERVVVAMSGGVDSSVAAALLLRAGYDVIGLTLQLRACEEQIATRSCCSEDGIAAARSVARALGIPHCVLDCHEEFGARVLRPAWNEYARGRTPSPCLICNREIKFGLLRAYASRLGARRLASGHYARIVDEGNGPLLMRAADRRKDQSYFLSAISPDALRELLLPVGALTKPEVRDMARALGLATAERGESQDACLVSDDCGLAESLRRAFDAPARPGPMVTPRGEVVGRHQGIHHFTIGQRRGLAIALGARAFVTAIDAEAATVVVSTDERDLYAEGLIARDLHWLAAPPARCQAQIRSRHEAAPGRLRLVDPRTAEFHFEQAQKAVTPGQAVAFFDGDRVLGGGTIERALAPSPAGLTSLEPA